MPVCLRMSSRRTLASASGVPASRSLNILYVSLSESLTSSMTAVLQILNGTVSPPPALLLWEGIFVFSGSISFLVSRMTASALSSNAVSSFVSVGRRTIVRASRALSPDPGPCPPGSFVPLPVSILSTSGNLSFPSPFGLLFMLSLSSVPCIPSSMQPSSMRRIRPRVSSPDSDGEILASPVPEAMLFASFSRNPFSCSSSFSFSSHRGRVSSTQLLAQTGLKAASGSQISIMNSGMISR